MQEQSVNEMELCGSKHTGDVRVLKGLARSIQKIENKDSQKIRNGKLAEKRLKNEHFYMYYSLHVFCIYLYYTCIFFL